MSTAIAKTTTLRDDVQALVDQHLASAPKVSRRIGPEVWKAYRTFRLELYAVCGLGAPIDQQDHREYIAGIGQFCRRVGL